MISRKDWEALTPVQQRDVCMNELADALQAADKNLRIQPFNQETRIIPGNTTLVLRRDDVIPEP